MFLLIIKIDLLVSLLADMCISVMISDFQLQSVELCCCCICIEETLISKENL